MTAEIYSENYDRSLRRKAGMNAWKIFIIIGSAIARTVKWYEEVEVHAAYIYNELINYIWLIILSYRNASKSTAFYDQLFYIVCYTSEKAISHLKFNILVWLQWLSLVVVPSKINIPCPPSIVSIFYKI